VTAFKVCGYEKAHQADVAGLFLAPENCWGTLQIPYQSRDEALKKLDNPPPGMTRLIALTEDGSRAIGLLALTQQRGRRAHTGDIGMFVHPEFHRQGAGSALMDATVELADRWLGLTRIELTVFVDNVAAIRLYEKYEFETEGVLRQYALRDGEYVDVLAMARLRSPIH
jgi:putative acetyltransferase